MSLNDIFKSSFLDNFTSSFSVIDTALILVVSFLIGLYIFAIYKKTFSGVLYSRNFNISLIAMTMTTALIIMGVTSNVVLSLGMVGALSIVRFRTAIKDPMDTVYLFWAVAAGILCGASQIPLAIIGSVVLGVILLLFVNKVTVENPYLLIVKCHSTTTEKALVQALGQALKRYNVKTKSIAGDSIELTYEIRLKGGNTEFINAISTIEGVESAVILAYDGNFAA